MRQATHKLCESIAIAIVATGVLVVLLLSLTDITSPFDREIAASFAKIAAHAPKVRP